MNGQIDAGEDAFIGGVIFNDAGSNRRDAIHQMSVEPKQRPKFTGQGEGDVLPGGLGKYCGVVSDPLIGGLFAAGRTKPGLAGMGYPNTVLALWASEGVIAQ